MPGGGDFLDGGGVACFVGDALEESAVPLPHSFVDASEGDGVDAVFGEVCLGASLGGGAISAAQPFGGEGVVESAAADRPFDAADGGRVVAEFGDGCCLFDGQLASVHGVALLGVAQGQCCLDLGAACFGAAGDLGGVETVVGQGLEQCESLAVGDGGAVLVLAPLGHEPVDGCVGAVALVTDDEGGNLGQADLTCGGGAAVAGQDAQGPVCGAADGDRREDPLLCDGLAEVVGQAQVVADVGVGEQLGGVDGDEFGRASGVVHDSSLHLF